MPNNENLFGNNLTYKFKDIIYISDLMGNIIHKATLISKYDHPILIFGESGTGKDMLANAIHNASLQCSRPLIYLVCSSFDEQFLNQDELKCILQKGGTLLLDEISDLSLSQQAGLLGLVKQYGLINPNNKNNLIKVMATTSKDLRKMCQDNLFRWDLYYRVAGIVIELPSLKNRREDIEILAMKFIKELNLREGLNKKISPKALKILKGHHWPGNIRELKNLIESGYILAMNNLIDEQIVKDLLKINDFTFKHLDEKLKKESLPKVLDNVKGNVTKAAKALGVSRTTIYRWLNEEKEGK